MKHFEEPSTIFLGELAVLADTLSSPSAFPLVDSLLSRLIPSPIRPKTAWPARDIPSLMSAVSTSQADFSGCLRNLKIALGAFLCVRNFFLESGYRTAEVDMTALDIRCAALRGNLKREGSYLGKMVMCVYDNSSGLHILI